MRNAFKLGWRAGICAFGLAIAMAGSAHTQAQPAQCEATEFGSKTGQAYLEAENLLIAEEKPQEALAALNKVRSMELNCYEEGAILRLGAAIKVQVGDYQGAVGDLKSAIEGGYVPADQVAQTWYNISQLHMQSNNIPKALEAMNRWIREGGQPDRDQKWQLAVLNHKAENNRESIRWAEEVLRMDGQDAKREVYDFLIFLYDKTGQLEKKAELLQELLRRNPGEKELWQAIAGDYFRAGNDRRAFEVQKAMYLAGLLREEDEVMRIVNFYNQFNVPYEAAKTLEKEMNAGRVSRNFDRLEMLANLYQVAREFEKAIPVIEEAATMDNSGKMYERLGRSYAELKEWSKTEDALTKALNAGNLKDRAVAWVLIGQSRYERGDTEGAIEAFRNSNSRGGRGWLGFIQSERETERALQCFELRSPVLEMENEKKACKQLRSLGEQIPDNCKTVDDRLAEAQKVLDESSCEKRS